MSHPLGEVFARLCGALPQVAGAEVILREDRRGATATLRVDGEAPRVFAAAADGVRELHPATDDGLPGVGLLADSRLLAATLEPLVGPIAGSRVVAWRPGRRAVVAVALQDGGGIWLKLLDRRGWRRASRTFAALSTAPLPMQLCAPIHLLPTHCCYVAPPAPGISLRAMLAAGKAPSLTTLSRALIALGFTPAPPELPALDFEVARRATVTVLGRAAAVRPELTALVERVEAMQAPSPLPAPGFVHGDLHDKQLFVEDGRVTVIDLEGAAVGDPRFDIANLVEHLRLRDLQQTGRDQGLADNVMVRCGLDPEAPTARTFRLLVRARLCGVYALRPRWRGLVDQLSSEVFDPTGVRP